MVRHLKALGRQPVEVSRALVHVEDSLAVIALEVMVVPMVHGFETCAFARQHHRGDLLCFQQLLEVAIHRGDAKTRYFSLGGIADLGGRQRPASRFDDGTDG